MDSSKEFSLALISEICEQVAKEVSEYRRKNPQENEHDRNEIAFMQSQGFKRVHEQVLLLGTSPASDSAA